MRIFSRYIFRNLLSRFCIVMLVLMSVIWLTQSMKTIDLIVNKGLGLLDFLRITAYLVPYVAFIVMPIAVFFTTISVLHRLASDNELTIFKSGGLSHFQMLQPILYFCGLIMLLHYVISLYLLPLSYARFKGLQSHFRNHYASIMFEENTFNTQNKMTFYVYAKSGDLYTGIVVYDGRSPSLVKLISAQRGKMVRTPQSAMLELYDGTHQEKNLRTGQISILYFDKYSFNINMLEEGSSRAKEPTEQFVWQLLSESLIGASKHNQSVAHGHFRLSWPLYCLSLSLLVASVILMVQYGRTKKIFRNIQIGCAALVMVMLAVLLNNVTIHHLWLAPLMYISPLLPIIAIILCVRRCSSS